MRRRFGGFLPAVQHRLVHLLAEPDETLCRRRCARSSFACWRPASATAAPMSARSISLACCPFPGVQARKFRSEDIKLTEVISVKFKNRGKVYFFDPHGIAVRTGDKVVVETSRGLELAECVQGNHVGAG